MTNDQLLTELIDALRKLNIAATDAAKNHYAARAAELETALRTQLAQAQPLLDAAAVWMASSSDGSRDASANLKLAAAAYVRAQAASAAKG